MALVRGNFQVGMCKVKEDIASMRRLEQLDPELHRHLEAAGAGGYQFCFQMLLLLFRRDLPWGEANLLWDFLMAWQALLLRREAHEGDPAGPEPEPGPGLSQPAAEAAAAEEGRPEGAASAPLAPGQGGPDAAAVLADLLAQLGAPAEASERERRLFRRLCVACGLALLMLNRYRLLECGGVEEVQRLSNRFKIEGPEGSSAGVGLHLAACAAALVQGKGLPSSAPGFSKAWRRKHTASDRRAAGEGPTGKAIIGRRLSGSTASGSGLAVCCMRAPPVVGEGV